MQFEVFFLPCITLLTTTVVFCLFFYLLLYSNTKGTKVYCIEVFLIYWIQFLTVFYFLSLYISLAPSFFYNSNFTPLPPTLCSLLLRSLRLAISLSTISTFDSDFYTASTTFHPSASLQFNFLRFLLFQYFLPPTVTPLLFPLRLWFFLFPSSIIASFNGYIRYAMLYFAILYYTFNNTNNGTKVPEKKYPIETILVLFVEIAVLPVQKYRTETKLANISRPGTTRTYGARILYANGLWPALWVGY